MIHAEEAVPNNFTVFNSRNRDPNTVYESDVYAVPDDQMVKLTMTVVDMTSEPITTVFYWSI